MTTEQVAAYRRDGVVVLPGFASATETTALQTRIAELCRTFETDRQRTVFSTTKQTTDAYFMESGDKIRFFLEEGAVAADGRLKVPIERAINKIGHGLHLLDPLFKAFTFQPAMQAVARALQLTDPLVAQSMYIFKQPGIGGEVVPHQDSTFLHTAPLTTVGFWMPLQDCTVTNGCLWAWKGSHRRGLDGGRRMVRTTPGALTTEFTAPPVEYDWAQFTPLEIARGDLVILHGELVHASQANASPQSRHAYTFHMIEAGAAYDNRNWLQPTAAHPFPRLFA